METNLSEEPTIKITMASKMLKTIVDQLGSERTNDGEIQISGNKETQSIKFSVKTDFGDAEIDLNNGPKVQIPIILFA